MHFEIESIDIDTLKKGYIFNSESSQYICLVCGAVFEIGEVFPFRNRFFDASKAVKLHLEQEHGKRFEELLNLESKYISLTENQKELFQMIHDGLSDKEIAEKLGITASTVRHQRFMFREKAKQAKMYLALYEMATENKPSDKAKIMPMHGGAKMVDDRYITTKEESEKIIENSFESLSPLKLKVFSAKEKKKIVVLTKIAEQFVKGRIYPEKEVNQILKGIYEDFVTLRRYLIEYGFMERSKDCKEYWLK